MKFLCIFLSFFLILSQLQASRELLGHKKLSLCFIEGKNLKKCTGSLIIQEVDHNVYTLLQCKNGECKSLLKNKVISSYEYEEIILQINEIRERKETLNLLSPFVQISFALLPYYLKNKKLSSFGYGLFLFFIVMGVFEFVDVYGFTKYIPSQVHVETFESFFEKIKFHKLNGVNGCDIFFEGSMKEFLAPFEMEFL